MLYMCIYVPLKWTSTSLVFHSHLASFFLFVHSCLLYLDTCIKSHSCALYSSLRARSWAYTGIAVTSSAAGLGCGVVPPFISCRVVVMLST